MSTSDDTLLLRRSRDGDPRAYGELVSRHRARIHATLLRLTRSQHDAENLCQDTFLKAYLSLGQFQERSSFATWLYRIAVNLGLNHVEKHKRSVPWDQDAHENLLHTEPLEDGFEQREALDLLREAIELLPPRQKETVLLRDYQGLSFAELAEVLDCPVGTAKANHFHAIRNLRKRLAGPEAPAEAPTSRKPAPASGVSRP